tara:strand:+ start:1093 stop:2181 length:1089 start_codon:yes stop_codon:yes gene_type:complete
MSKQIKLFDPFVGIEEEKSITKTLHSHFWASGAGTNLVNEFEQKFKTYVSSKDCIAVNSGTAALNLALSLVDIKNKDVIVPSLTFVSTVNAIKFNNGNPIFIDIDPKTGCLDSEILEKTITKKTKAILPVHFGGLPCNLKEIKKISKKHNLHLIEDAAHAVGSSFDNKKIGSHGDFVCFSFHPVKNLAMPTGGLISLNNTDYKKTKEILKSKRWCGITNRTDMFYDVKELANNYYMNEFSASIGLVQLKKLNKMNSIRKKIAKKYHKQITLENKMPFVDGCSYHLYWIRVKRRNQFIKKMSQNKIQVGVHYKPVHEMTLYKNMKKLPITENFGKSVVSLPMHPNLSNADVEKVIDCVNKFAI